MKIPLLSKFGSKIYNGLFKLKLRIETNSNGELDGDIYFSVFQEKNRVIRVCGIQ